MPTITKLEPQKRRPHRYNLFIDNKFTTGIGENVVIELNLKVGQEISAENLESLKETEKKDKLLELALGYLEYRPRSEREIIQHLKKKLYQKKELFSSEAEREEALEEVLEKLKSMRLIDDKAFGEWWLGQRQSARNPKGAWAIRSELAQKGLSSELIDQLLASIEPEDERARVQKILEKQWLPKRDKMGEREWRAKATKYLARRGFDYGIIGEMLK
ncbi:RecX family transcriptional regulator [Patescibacteria group bacterium]|nr:RecX family transcriptional regulator [Patescibacteria group bacterium]